MIKRCYIYDALTDYGSISVEVVVNIHKYLIKKDNIKWYLGLLN